MNLYSLLLPLKNYGQEFIALKRSSLGEGGIFVNWALSNVCNYKCSYCSSELNDGSKKIISLNDIKDFITHITNQAKAQDKKVLFEFGGGEPTCIQGIYEILNLIHQQNGRVLIISNGSSSLNWWKKNIKNIYEVQLSYHREFCQEEHFIEISKFLTQSGVKTHISLMTHPHHVEEIHNFAQKLNSLIRCTLHMQILRSDFGGANHDKFIYSEDDMKKISSFHNKIVLRPSYYLSTLSRSMLFVDQSGKSRRVNLNKIVWNKKNCFKNWNCYSGLQTLVIDFEGDIYRGWCKEGGKIGSIYQNFKFPTEPIKCQKEFCDCKFDFQSEKIRKDYRPGV